MTDMTVAPNMDMPAPLKEGRITNISGLFRMGWILIAAVFGGLILWSIFAPFQGAVLTSGTIAVESNQQAVQHLSGGIVRSINVRDGDRVEAGQVLLSLDNTMTQANLSMVDAQLFDLLGTEARLVAERDGLAGLRLRPEFADFADETAFQNVLLAQAQLMAARADSRATQVSILEQRKRQLYQQIAGFRSEVQSKQQQENLVSEELTAYASLEAKGLVTKPRLLALRRDMERLSGERQALVSNIAATRVRVGETESEIDKLTQGFQEEVQTELRMVQTQISELIERRVAATEELDRVDIVAPRAGYVLGTTTHTVGGVITSGEPIMFIVPEDSRLIAQVRIAPMDIDKITIGQAARLRFSAFSADATPEVEGSILKVSADALIDQATGIPYYEAVVEIPPERLAETKFRLVPGMPVDVLVQTESRSVLSYLFKPLGDAMSKTFRE